MTIYTTLNKILKFEPCELQWNKLLAYLNKTEADDEHLDFSTIFKSNGLFDALWCTRSAPEHDKEWRLFAVWCARRWDASWFVVGSVAKADAAEAAINVSSDAVAVAANVARCEAVTYVEASAAAEAAREAETKAQTERFLEVVR